MYEVIPRRRTNLDYSSRCEWACCRALRAPVSPGGFRAPGSGVSGTRTPRSFPSRTGRSSPRYAPAHRKHTWRYSQCWGSESGIRCFFDIWIRDPDPGYRMNIPDHFSESLETVFWVKNTYILWCGSGSGIFWQWNREPGSGINILDPQQWVKYKGNF